MSNCVDDHPELTIILTFQLIEPTREFGIRSKHLAELYKVAQNLDVYLHRAVTVEDTRQHEDSVFGEGIWEIFDVASAFQGHRL